MQVRKHAMVCVSARKLSDESTAFQRLGYKNAVAGAGEKLTFIIRASDSSWHPGLPGRPLAPQVRSLKEVRCLQLANTGTTEIRPLHVKTLKRVNPAPRKGDVRLPGKENSNSHGARPVHLIITMMLWIRIRRLSIKNSLAKPRT